MMNKLRAEDQDVRDAALDVGGSFIVRAPAGSGKTKLLIQRYLALLAGVEEPEEIVAITFTRKAAAEMRERVLAAFAEAHNTSSTLDQQTRALARAAQARDAACGWQLARNASRLRIQTIDALNASLTRQMPLAARFGAQPESVDDARPLYREAAGALLAEVNGTDAVAADVATLLAHLDNNLAVAEELLAEMLRTRDHWLRNLTQMDQREALEAALSRVCARAIDDATRRFPPEERDETLALAGFSRQNMLERPANAGVSPDALLAEWPQTGESALPAWLVLADLLLTQGGSFRKRKGLNKNCGFPTSTDKQEKAVLDQYKARMGDVLERLESGQHESALAQALDQLRRLPPGRYSDAQWEVLGAIVRLLPVATGVLWTVFAAKGQCDFTEIAQAATRALGDDDAPSDLALALDYRIRHLLVDEFQDTSFAQFELLEKLTRGWSAGDGRTLMVVGDPMQSIYRFREAEVGLFLRAMHQGIGDVALTPLTLTVNFRSTPGIVGWMNQTFSVLMPDEEDAAAGRVPYAASVAFVGAGDGAGTGVGNGAEPSVQWHAAITRAADDEGDDPVSAGFTEAQDVVGVIRATRQEQPDAEIALLVRNRAHLADIVPALKQAGIAYRAVDIDPLGERPVVQDLLALTRALMHPADRIAWLAVLRAPWCGLTLQDLAALTNGAVPVDGALAPDPRTLWEMLCDEARVAALAETGRQRAIALRDVLRPALARRRRLALRELVEQTWLALRGPACLGDAADLDDAMRLLDVLEVEAHAQTGGTHIVDLAKLDASVATLYAGNLTSIGHDKNIGNPGPPPVQIMTIHKAKGLEFDTVIVPALHRAQRKDDKKLLVWSEQPDPETGAPELLLAPIREAGADEDTDAIYRYVQQCDRDKQRHEDVRLLYVAATRAIRRLHLFASVRAKVVKGEETLGMPRAGSLLAPLWPVVEAVFQETLNAPPDQPPAGLTAEAAGRMQSTAVADAEKTAEARPATRLAVTQCLPAMPANVSIATPAAITTPATTVDFEWAGETARHVGSVVHGFLQRMAEDGLAAWNPARIRNSHAVFEAELARLGVVAEELPGAIQRVATALATALADARGRWVLDAHADAKSEWRLSGVFGDGIINIAIDRTFVDETGVRWIIDFKTGSHEGGDPQAFLDNEQRRYRGQLESYAAIIAALNPADAKAPIRLGLYFPMLSGWREWAWSGQPAVGAGGRASTSTGANTNA